MVVATKISLDLIKENLCSQHEQQQLPQMTRARAREDEGCSLPKSAEKISCFIAGGGGLFCFFDIQHRNVTLSTKQNRLCKKQKEDSFFTLVVIMHLLTRPVASIRNDYDMQLCLLSVAAGIRGFVFSGAVSVPHGAGEGGGDGGWHQEGHPPGQAHLLLHLFLTR